MPLPAAPPSEGNFYAQCAPDCRLEQHLILVGVESEKVKVRLITSGSAI